MNITECCAREKVSSGCMDACSFFMDVESILDKPQCLPDFDKLMRCSAGKLLIQSKKNCQLREVSNGKQNLQSFQFLQMVEIIEHAAPIGVYLEGNN